MMVMLVVVTISLTFMMDHDGNATHINYFLNIHSHSLCVPDL